MRRFVFMFLAGWGFLGIAMAQVPQSELRQGEAASQALPSDPRDGELINLNGYFPFHPVTDTQQWAKRKEEIRRRILVSQGLWPMPTKSDLNAVIHGRVEREDYLVDRVFFESAPGHFVTGSLYRPKDKQGPFPTILSPHGHWNQGRFYDAGEKEVESQVAMGAEQDEVGGRFPIQARAVQLARMGCMVFVYDMTGNADSIQIGHRPNNWTHLDKPEDWGFMSVQADLRLQNMMGLQTWNSIRTIDFLLSLPEVDPNRIGVTGASGGGTQSMLISAVDDRIAAAMPCVMVSTAMQGGCTCENAPLLRIDQGNVDIAAATAPRPLGLTAADDWTIELETKGYPDLVRLYEMLGASDRLTAVFHTEFKHNYNLVNRMAMYSFFNRHFGLGWDEPIVERPYVPLTRDEATVWTDDHPAPSGDRVGDSHEVRLLQMATADSDRQIQSVVMGVASDPSRFQAVVGGGWQTVLGRRLEQVGKVQFVPSDNSATSNSETSGHLIRSDNNETVAVRRHQPKSNARGTVILVTDHGLASLKADSPLAGEAPLAGTVQQLVDAGYAILAANLFRQDDPQLQSQPMWYQSNGGPGWQGFSGYTYGYNHSLFVKRVHDILTMIAFADTEIDGPVHLVGLGPVAGPLALAARSQSGTHLDKTIVDLGGFRFRQLRKHDDLMFVPGAVKYLDVDGLLAVCAPAEVYVKGIESLPVAERVYKASSDPSALKRLASPTDLTRLLAGQ